MSLPTQTVDTLVIGAGFSGLAIGVELRRRGLEDFVILEKAQGVGGTWRFNAYPGAACDIPANLYSFSYAPNPGWSHRYARQPEILAYLESFADRYDLRRHLRLGVEVRRAAFDVERGRYHVECADGRDFDARALVLGNGALHLPSIPRLPGIEAFEGQAFHTAEWPSEYDARGKRIAVIGAGASAIQIVPELAPIAAAVYVHQRTPPWILPRHDRAIGTLEKQLNERLPALQRLERIGTYWRHESRAIAFLRWPRLMDWGEREARAYLRRSIANPDLREALTPAYRMGCKRVLLSNEYYPTLQRENVELVTEPIESVSEQEMRTTDGRERVVDTIVYATGFQATNYLSKIEIVGATGRSLNATWRRRPGAYLGMHVAGFPNLFLMTGPNTGLGHNSMVFMIEAQARHIAQCIRWIVDEKLSSISVRLPVQAAYNTDLRARLARTVWASGCTSWYLAAGGLNLTLWPGFTFDYRRRTRQIRETDFEVQRATSTTGRPDDDPISMSSKAI